MQPSSMVKKFASLSAIAGLIGIIVPANPASALIPSSREDYRECAARLINAGIEASVAAPACASMLHPEDMARCVDRIDFNTDLNAADALVACRQVRRPLDLSDCVIDINYGTREPQLFSILDSCRRSLLPERFANCVVGLSSEIDLTSNQAMFVCIDAKDRIRDVYPSFVPREDGSSVPGTI